MKKIWLLATFVGLWPGLGFAQTTEELVNDGKNPENVTTQSMGYDRKSYSPLKQINKSNVKRLVPIWSTSLMNDSGELAAPEGKAGKGKDKGKVSRVPPEYNSPTKTPLHVDIQPGQQVLIVKLPKTGPVMLAGDLYHFREERAGQFVPRGEADREQSRASRKAIEDYIEKRGIQLWIEHDTRLYETLKPSPDFLE